MSTNPLSVPYPFGLSNIERRELARAEMATRATVGKFMYLLHSRCIRKVPLDTVYVAHSAVDIVNVLGAPVKKGKTDFDPRYAWRDLKERMLKNDPNMCARISHIPFPLWNDRKGRARLSDAITTGGLFLVIMDMHSPLSNEIRGHIADLFDRIPFQYRDQVLLEMERDSGWAATQNHLIMSAHHSPEDFDNPKEPPSGIPDTPRLWRPKA